MAQEEEEEEEVSWGMRKGPWPLVYTLDVPRGNLALSIHLTGMQKAFWVGGTGILINLHLMYAIYIVVVIIEPWILGMLQHLNTCTSYVFASSHVAQMKPDNPEETMQTLGEHVKLHTDYNLSWGIEPPEELKKESPSPIASMQKLMQISKSWKDFKKGLVF